MMKLMYNIFRLLFIAFKILVIVSQEFAVLYGCKCISYINNYFEIHALNNNKYSYSYRYSTCIHNIATKLANINILYVKLFQAFTLNHQWLDEATNQQLLKFTDNAPWTFSDIDLTSLVAMTDKHGIDLRHNYEVPINSGMISLVFKGYIKNTNKSVAIKMKRVNIEALLDDALEQINTCMYLCSYFSFVKQYQLENILYKNIELIKNQTHFNKEVENIRIMKNNCSQLKYVKIPYVYSNITDEYPNIIVMEFIDGLKINEIKKEDSEPFAKLVIKFGLVSTVIHGIVHGDLHAGNILFIKNNTNTKTNTNIPVYQIGILDFGIMFPIEMECKDFLFKLFSCMFEQTSRNTAIFLLNSSFFEPPGIMQQLPREEYDNIVSICQEIIETTLFQSKKANQIQIYQFLYKIKDYFANANASSPVANASSPVANASSNNKIRLSDQFVQLQLILAMAHGVTLALCSDNFIPIMDQVFNELFHLHLLMD